MQEDVGIAYAVATHALASNLFLSFPSFSSLTPYDMPTPNSSFGVFVTVRRSAPVMPWPADVHGCIGYWTDDWSALSNRELLRHTFDVGRSALFDDSRRLYFPAIETDAGATIEVSFMQLPVWNIDAATGRIETHTTTTFNNCTYGVIVENARENSRATYLPGVFPNDDWTTIRNSVVEKAHTTQTQTARFYAYKTIIRRVQLLDIFLSFVTSRQLQRAFCITLLRGYLTTNFVPYAVNYNARFVVDKTEDVRNIATVVAALSYNANLKLQAYLKRDVETFVKRIDTLSDQALAFLLPETHAQLRTKSCMRLTARLPFAERVFESGELQVGVATYCRPRWHRHRHFIPIVDYDDIANIFQWNWDSQALAATGTLQKRRIRRRYETWAKKWWDAAPVTTRETNELAVFLESVPLYVSTPRDVLSFAALAAFLEVVTRYHDGVFFFRTPATDARMDITVHILNGLARVYTTKMKSTM